MEGKVDVGKSPLKPIGLSLFAHVISTRLLDGGRGLTRLERSIPCLLKLATLMFSAASEFVGIGVRKGEAARLGELRAIAPKRFNPSGEAWLPILHARRGDWRFTALYSNTALAHELGRVKDWVVVYYETDALPEGQCTIVTETRGPIAGRRS